MKKWIAIALLVLLVAVPVVMKMSRGDAGKAVETEKVQLRALAPSILASGTLTYQSEVKLVSEVIGRVQHISVQEGDQVRQGDLLLQLDPATQQAQVLQLEAAARQSRLAIDHQHVTSQTLDAKWKRYQELRRQGLIDATTFEEIDSQHQLAKVEYDTTNEQLAQTEAQLKQARENLAKTQLRAPISGRVTAVYIKTGETAVPSAMSIAGSDLMVVADTASQYAEVNVNETDVARVGVGQPAKIVPAAFPDSSWQGTVERVAVSPRLQTAGQSKTYLVKIRLDGTGNIQFHTGMSCRAEISTRRADATPALAVPVQAVKYEEQTNKEEKAKASVFVVQPGGKVARKDVDTGAADDLYVELLRGVKSGDEIVIGPAKTLRFLRDGDRVTATPATEAATPAAKPAAKSAAAAGSSHP